MHICFTIKILRIDRTLDSKIFHLQNYLLYEWVEDEIDGNGFILASDVRYQAGVLAGSGFDKSAKFKDLGKRMNQFLKLTVTGTNRARKYGFPKYRLFD